MTAGDAHDLAVHVERLVYGDVDDALAEVAARLAMARSAPVPDGVLVSELAADALTAALPPDLDTRVARTTGGRMRTLMRSLRSSSGSESTWRTCGYSGPDSGPTTPWPRPVPRSPQS